MSARLLCGVAAAAWLTTSLDGAPREAAARGQVERAVASLPVTAVDTIGMTVGDMDRALRFYTSVLTFEKVSDREIAGREYELLTGVFGARARVARLRLGGQAIELTEFLAPKGRPFPAEMRPNDRGFQHMAIVVSDMDAAYVRLRRAGVEHASTGPQRLPDWNPNAGGISAFYFRDPDRHFLELLQFPPGKGGPEWQRTDGLFLGIDHTAVVTGDTDLSLRFYRDLLRMRVAGESENYDVEQEHLNNVFGARLRITTLKAPAGPGIELLEYLAPRNGRPAPLDLAANDVAHWETTLVTADPDQAFRLARARLFSLVSPRSTSIGEGAGFGRAVLLRDPDGHAMRLAAPAGNQARAATSNR